MSDIPGPRLVKHMASVPGRHVFPPNGSRSQLFDRILKRARIPKKNALGEKLTRHSFRHTFATIRPPVVAHSPFLLKAILGHCHLSTTDRYVHARSEAMVIDVASLTGLGVTDGCEPENKEADSEESAEGISSNISN